jgi:flagellar hook-basal body complex protein FliE
MNNVSLGGIPSSYLPEPSSLGGAEGGDGLDFGAVLKNAVQGVDQLNKGAGAQVSNLLQGGGGDMTSVEKADVSFQLMMQVRNKIVNAYQDIEKMQF